MGFTIRLGDVRRISSADRLNQPRRKEAVAIPCEVHGARLPDPVKLIFRFEELDARVRAYDRVVLGDVAVDTREMDTLVCRSESWNLNEQQLCTVVGEARGECVERRGEPSDRDKACGDSEASTPRDDPVAPVVKPSSDAASAAQPVEERLLPFAQDALGALNNANLNHDEIGVKGSDLVGMGDEVANRPSRSCERDHLMLSTEIRLDELRILLAFDKPASTCAGSCSLRVGDKNDSHVGQRDERSQESSGRTGAVHVPT